jgi:hypothetical protein
VPCELCGGGDRWIKTCLAPGGSRLLVCDACWEEHAGELVIVPGDHVVVARCGSCGAYGNPRGFADVRLGGRKGAYSGTCPACAGEEGR